MVELATIDNPCVETMLSQYRQSKQRLAAIEAAEKLATQVIIGDTLGYGFYNSQELQPLTRSLNNRVRHAHSAERKMEAMHLRYNISQLDHIIEMLQPKHRDVITALYIDGLTYDETCEKLFIARSTLNKRRHEAIDEMHRLMA